MRVLFSSLLLLVFAAAAQGQLLNADMETQSGAEFSTNENWAFGLGGGWTYHSSFPAPNNGTLGERFGFWSADAPQIMAQESSLAFAPTSTYTFSSWAIGGGNLLGKLPYQIGYLDGGTDLDANFVELATSIVDLDGQSEWLPQSGVTYTTGAAGPELGRNIVVRFAGVDQGGDSDIWVDNAWLTPEPASLALLGLGGLFFVRRRR